MIVVDAMGKVCPVPVIETKKAIEGMGAGGGTLRVLVDNAIACENLDKFSQSRGYKCASEKLGERSYAVTITVGDVKTAEKPTVAIPKEQVSEDELVVAIGQDKMGGGDEALGKILIKGFIFSLVNLDVPPSAVLFFNSGVKLTLSDANTLDDLRSLINKGTKIFVCGTCVDFYGVKDKVAAGEITNMYNIVETLRLARSVINI
jgi:selenium metabolism protein YedF